MMLGLSGTAVHAFPYTPTELRRKGYSRPHEMDHDCLEFICKPKYVPILLYTF